MALDQRILVTLRDLDQRTAQKDFSGCLQSFLLSCQVNNLSPATIDYYQDYLRYFFKFCHELNLSRPDEVTPNHIRLYMLYCQQKGCKPVSVATRFRAIKRFFNWLEEEGVIEKAPLRHVKPPKVPDTIIKPFTVEEFKRMFAVCEDNYCGVRNRAILLVFLDTGLRLREMAEIRLEDVTMGGCIKVMGKGAKERIVKMSPATLRCVLAYRKLCKLKGFNSEMLWLGEEGRPLNKWGIVSLVRRICDRAGVKGSTEAKCSPHTFRHTCATLYLHNGGDTSSLQTLLGHSTQAMTRHYARTGLIEEAVKVHERASPVRGLIR